MSYQLTLHAYCGMSFPLEDRDLEECRDRAALEIRKHRRSGRHVEVLDKGRRWEMLEADNAAMVYDDCGVMALNGGEDDA